MPEIFSKRRMVSENKGNPFVDLFFFVLQIISVTCNFTSLWKPTLYNFVIIFPCQAIRVKQICSTVETTKQRLGDLRHHLKRREYNDKVIESGFSKASEITCNRNDQCLGWQLLGERYWCLSVGLGWQLLGERCWCLSVGLEYKPVAKQ
jgi:hypothetical protein